mmetsp:Transcript_11273/g.24292  ORF Transcript_11273/g.24292 Transcript_11273/m.24292 type:complete len:223 (+) Transcript_11273:567-1235(+)
MCECDSTWLSNTDYPHTVLLGNLQPSKASPTPWPLSYHPSSLQCCHHCSAIFPQLYCADADSLHLDTIIYVHALAPLRSCLPTQPIRPNKTREQGVASLCCPFLFEFSASRVQMCKLCTPHACNALCLLLHTSLIEPYFSMRSARHSLAFCLQTTLHTWTAEAAAPRCQTHTAPTHNVIQPTRRRRTQRPAAELTATLPACSAAPPLLGARPMQDFSTASWQ